VRREAKHELISNTVVLESVRKTEIKRSREFGR
jgi:hypothetical protein